jgi:toxin-antitoxin system PIN domain toxin
VIAVDTNILVYAHRADTEWHDTAARAVAGLAEGTAEWAIPWPCLHEFLAIVTHPRIFKTPTPPDLAFGQIDAWLESPTLVVLSENDDHSAALRDLALAARVSGPRVHDARVAALCISHGVRELWTADRDFSLFAGLKTRNPLAA